MSTDDVRHPLNVPGPFYIVDGCCTACMVPHSVAPTMMSYDEEARHCFVRKQPEGDEEGYQAIRALWSSELACLRYGGRDPEILRRLVELGEESACDEPAPPGIVPLLRNHVTFEAAWAVSNRQVADTFVDYLIRSSSAACTYKTRPLREDGQEWRLSFSWYESHYHTLWFGQGEPQTGRSLIRHSPKEKTGSRGLSFLLDDWLRGLGVPSLRWYTAAAWANSGHEWQDTPY